MYYKLNYICKIAYLLSGPYTFHASFSTSLDGTPVPCEAASIEELVKQIHREADSRKMSRQHFEAEFQNKRKYSDRGGTIKYSSPFTESEEKTFLLLLMETINP